MNQEKLWLMYSHACKQCLNLAVATSIILPSEYLKLPVGCKCRSTHSASDLTHLNVLCDRYHQLETVTIEVTRHQQLPELLVEGSEVRGKGRCHSTVTSESLDLGIKLLGLCSPATLLPCNKAAGSPMVRPYRYFLNMIRPQVPCVVSCSYVMALYSSTWCTP